MLGRKRVRKSLSVEELGLNLGSISESDLEELAAEASERLASALDELVGRQSYYVSTVRLEFDEERRAINAIIEVGVSSPIQPSPELITSIDSIIDECFEVIRNELIRKFKSS
ncbi:MAG: hypothetical protein J7L51_01045 [Desulfurococcales archaeon]|nr:hypothetical protein [Desulfurococcales archaeon]